MNNNIRRLTVFSLVMITVGSVDSIRNLPSTALFGTSLIFFFLVGALFFLIPCALVSAELSSAFTEDGGVYVWVKEAFGKHWGFVAIWFQWLENVVWYPTILSFVAGTLAFIIDPALAHHRSFLVTVILLSFWGATIINLYGMHSSALFSSFCSLVGLILPMILVILLGFIWRVGGHVSQIHFGLHDFIPNLKNPSMWVSLTGIMMSFCGMEIATVHAKEVKNPQKAFPKALFYSTAIILSTLILGSLAIAIVLPRGHISLVAGIMQAYGAFFYAYHLAWFVPIMGVLLIIGGMGGVSNWIIAPTQGLLIAAHDDHLPRWFEYENKYRSPVTLLLFQGVIVSALTLVFLLLPSVNASYWFLTALASQIYMLMYILMFAAGIYLRYRHADKERPYRVPFGKAGMWIIGVMGIIASIATIVVGFIPPEGINIGSLLHYEGMLILGLALIFIPPLLTYCWDLRRNRL